MRKVKQADVHSWPLLDTGRSLLYRKRFEKHTKLIPSVHRNLSNVARVQFTLSEEHNRAQVARKRGNNFIGGVSTIGLLSDKTDNYVRSTVTSLVSDLVNMKDWADRTCTPMCSLQNSSKTSASLQPLSLPPPDDHYRSEGWNWRAEGWHKRSSVDLHTFTQVAWTLECSTNKSSLRTSRRFQKTERSLGRFFHLQTRKTVQ